jgi:hypothetical protein
MVSNVKLPEVSTGDLILYGGGALVLFIMIKGWSGAGEAAGGAVVDLVTGVLKGTANGIKNLVTADPIVYANNLNSIKFGGDIQNYGKTKEQILKGDNAWGLDLTGGW